VWSILGSLISPIIFITYYRGIFWRGFQRGIWGNCQGGQDRSQSGQGGRDLTPRNSKGTEIWSQTLEAPREMHWSGQGIVRRDACDGTRVAEQDREAEEGEEEGQSLGLPDGRREFNGDDGERLHRCDCVRWAYSLNRLDEHIHWTSFKSAQRVD
jgi:hypothetical protein